MAGARGRALQSVPCYTQDVPFATLTALKLGLAHDDVFEKRLIIELSVWQAPRCQARGQGRREPPASAAAAHAGLAGAVARQGALLEDLLVLRVSVENDCPNIPPSRRCELEEAWCIRA